MAPQLWQWHLSFGKRQAGLKVSIEAVGDGGWGGQSSVCWYLEASSQKLQSVRKNWYCHGGMCAQYIDVSDECLPVCLGDEVGVGGGGGGGLGCLTNIEKSSYLVLLNRTFQE